MTDNQKHHYFMFSAIYKDLNIGEIHQFHYGTFGLPYKEIKKSQIKKVENQTIEGLKVLKPESNISDYSIISMSYLGEMTEAEFNS